MTSFFCFPFGTVADDPEIVSPVNVNFETPKDADLTLKLISPIKESYDRISVGRYFPTSSFLELNDSLFMFIEKFNADRTSFGTYVYNLNMKELSDGYEPPIFVFKGESVKQSAEKIVLLHFGNASVTTKKFIVIGDQPVGFMNVDIRPIKAEELFIHHVQSSYKWLDNIKSAGFCKIILPTDDISMFKHPAFQSLNHAWVIPQHQNFKPSALAEIPATLVNFHGLSPIPSLYAAWNTAELPGRRQISITSDPDIRAIQIRSILQIADARKTKLGDFYCVTIPFTHNREFEFNVGFFSNHAVVAIIRKGKAQDLNWRAAKDYDIMPEWPILLFNTSYDHDWVQFEKEEIEQEETAEERLARVTQILLRIGTVSQGPPEDPF